MTKVIITGATGFVGRQIIRCLDAAGVVLIPVVRADKKDLFFGVHGIERVIVTSDLFAEDEAWWEDQCLGADLVIHAAWYSEPGKYLQSSLNIDCLIGSLRMSRGAAKAGVKRLVGIGTCAEYDQSDGLLTVDTEIKPATPYAAAKAALFLALSQWLPTQFVSFAWCRLFYLYGEFEDERRLVPYIRQQLKMGKPAELTSGNQIRDFMDITDAGKLIVDIALSSRTGPFNICSGVPITVRQLAESIADEFGRRDFLQFGVRPDNLFDPPSVIGVPNY
jgi:nucleoside-diphosphate-sugar epimerase